MMFFTPTVKLAFSVKQLVLTFRFSIKIKWRNLNENIYMLIDSLVHKGNKWITWYDACWIKFRGMKYFSRAKMWIFKCNKTIRKGWQTSECGMNGVNVNRIACSAIVMRFHTSKGNRITCTSGTLQNSSFNRQFI